MYRKLDEKSVDALLETGIEEFAEHGLDRANINQIAKKAGVSVGVIYKYYPNKDSFFLACVRHSLKLLDSAMADVLQSEGDLMGCIRVLVEDLIRGAGEHPSYYVMYNEITSGSCRRYAVELAREIESVSSRIYTGLIEKAKEEGRIRWEADPRMFAFFFDNLLMMLQFSFSCDYYKERMRIFCGEDIEENTDKLTESLVRMIRQALMVPAEEEEVEG